MKNNLILISISLLILVSVLTITSAWSTSYDSPTPANASSVYGGSVLIKSNQVVHYGAISYNVSFSGLDLSNFSKSLAYLFDENGFLSPVNDNYNTYGEFNGLADGAYDMQVEVFDVDGNSNLTETRTIYVVNDFYVAFVDPTFTNNTITNNNFVHVKAQSNRNYPIFNISIYNYSDGSLVDFSSSVSTGTMKYIDNTFTLLDGKYIFVASSNNGSLYLDESRTITIDTTKPTLDNITTSPNLTNGFNTNGYNGNITFNLSEDNVSINLRIFDSSNNVVKALSFSDVNSTSLPLAFSLNGLSAGTYSMNITVVDSAGNTNQYEVTSFNVNSISNNGGGNNIGGGSRFILNNTNTTLPVSNNTNSTIGNQTNSTNSGFFSGITGAVTGALGKRSVQIVIYVIIVLVLAYLALLIRRKYYPSSK